MKGRKVIEVVCGIIYKEDKIFIARKKPDKKLACKWEFPGGEIEDDESAEEALQRELIEEIGMNVHVLECLGENPHSDNHISIKLVAFKCDFIAASYELTDHDKYEWVFKDDLGKFDLAEADVPLIGLID
jgi:8-oxo-dGTP diphosphatase